jgi:hypothetical protein
MPGCLRKFTVPHKVPHKTYFFVIENGLHEKIYYSPRLVEQEVK